MADLQSFPFDAVSGDRVYEAQKFRNYFYKFLSTGVYFGTYKDYGDYSMKVVPSLELNVRVTKGAGLIKGLDFEAPQDIVLPITLSLGSIRKDMVVVKADDTLPQRKTTVYVKEGTSTEFPALERTTDIYELCLAKITVGDTETTVDLEDIEDTRRDADLCGIVSSLIDIDIQDVLDDITVKEEAFFVNAQADFEAWLETLQDILDESTAGHLLNLINANTANITTNTEDIAENTTNIATNTENIAENTTDIAENATNIAGKQEKAEQISSEETTYAIASFVGNKVYNLTATALTSLTISASVADLSNESTIYFNSGAIGTALTIPTSWKNIGDVPELTVDSTTSTATCTANKSYIISVLNNIAVFKEV